jgi:hypothetical protein
MLEDSRPDIMDPRTRFSRRFYSEAKAFRVTLHSFSHSGVVVPPMM